MVRKQQISKSLVGEGQIAPVLAHDFESLLSLWSQDRRAKGGWWALAGFSFQSVFYLLRFFEGIQDGSKSPAELAKTELLSDITVPNGGVYTLIQVKRTLDRPRLAAALREAYEIASLCDETFLAKLRFQVACLQCETPVLPENFEMHEVVGVDGNPRTWKLVLQCFKSKDSIVEEPDPLYHLYDFLWHVGIRDTVGFVDGCLGTLLRLFSNPSQEAIAKVAWELSSTFHLARPEGQAPPERLGLLLQSKSFDLDPDAGSDHGVLFDRRPRLRDLQLGRVRQRPDVFSELVKKFTKWWHATKTANEDFRVPVFWIDGRSGEGKSVLLLQLAQHILLASHSPVISYLSSPSQLPAWIKTQTELQMKQTNSNWLPTLAIVDDMHLIGDQEEWKIELNESTNLMSPRIAVIACGPTLECSKFVSDFSRFFDIERFSVPNLDQMEMKAFGDWVAKRTGKPFSLSETSPANRMLVIWMFEILQGKSLRDFGASFKSRLVNLGVFELTKSMLAVNALELPIPLGLIDNLPDLKRDQFLALCSDSQLHFEQTDPHHGSFGGYRLSHPQIVWHLYLEWASPPATLAQHWGRDLGLSLIAAIKSPDPQLVFALIFRLATSTKLSEDFASKLPTQLGSIDQAIIECYRKQNYELLVEETVLYLPRWLEAIFRQPSLVLDPDPLQYAIKLSTCRPLLKGLHPSAAGWIWRISEIGFYKHNSEALRMAAQSILFEAPEKPGIAQTLRVIASKSMDQQAALQFCKRWLEANPAQIDAYIPLETLVAASPHDADLLSAARRWIEGNPTHQQAYNLLAALVAGRPEDETVIAAALKWIGDNPTHRQAYKLLAALVAGRPEDEIVIAVALSWIGDNPTHSQAYELLAALVAGRPEDETVIAVALKWIGDNPTHQQAYELLRALVAGRPEDETVIAAALTWIGDNPTHQQAYNLLAALVAGRPEDETVIATALKWIENNLTHQRAYELLAALVAGRPEDEKVIKVARHWLNSNAENSQSYNLVSTLITRSDGAEEWMTMGKHLLVNATNAGKRTILVSLLAGSKVAKLYVDLTLDTISSETNIGNKTYLKKSLDRALANNLKNSIQFLSGDSTSEFKKSASMSLARGLSQSPSRAQEFLELIKSVPSTYVGPLLSACIASEVTSELLNPILQLWLNDHHRALGYGGVLRSLNQHPSRWKALMDFGDLNLAVQMDYQQLVLSR